MKIDSRLRALLNYDAATGVFRWLVAPNRRIKPGSVAGCLDTKGYRYIICDGRRYLEGRLAWFYTTGAWPKDQIDHIDGNKSNNRFANLREATQSQNMQNQRRAMRSNKIGVLGVSLDRGKFRAQIWFDGKQKFLGYFATAEAAHAAYLAAKRKFHPTCTI